MNLKTVIVAVLCISCAAATGHEVRCKTKSRDKWMKWEESEKECDEPDYKEPEHSSIGSVPGKPGVDFPNFTEIPNTKFSCADKERVPGFYPDLDTGCQVFHVCYENRRESFLCPVGTIFSAALKTCDYWYSAECIESAKDESGYVPEPKPEIVDPVVEELLDIMFGQEIQPKGGSPIKGGPRKYKKSTTEQSTTTEHWHKPTTEAPFKQSLKDGASGFLSKKEQRVDGEKILIAEDSAKSGLSSSMKEASEIASVILKSLLPVKSKVVDLIVEQSSKSGDSIKRDKSTASSKPTAVPTTTEYLPKTTVKPKTTPTTTPWATVAPRPAMVPVKAKPIWQQPMKKPMIPFKPGMQHGKKAASLPVSPMTKKQLALNYAKLWKMKKLSSPLMGLLKSL